MENVIEQGTETEIKTEKKSIGKLTGLRFIKAWGFYFEKFQNVPNNRELIKEEMLKEFPNKKESVLNWDEWYKSYANMGKIKGYEKFKNEKMKWVPAPKVEEIVQA